MIYIFHISLTQSKKSQTALSLKNNCLEAISRFRISDILSKNELYTNNVLIYQKLTFT